MSCKFPVLVAAMVLCCSFAAKADPFPTYTYSGQVLPDEGTFVAADIYGDYLAAVGGGQADGLCQDQWSGTCYLMYTASTGITIASEAALTLAYPSYGQGSGYGCPDKPSWANVAYCSNGYEFFSADGENDAGVGRGIYDGPDPATDFLSRLDMASISSAYILTPNGTLYYESDYAANILHGSPVTSVTPEPSSFALLGSGLLGVTGVLRRRVA